MLTLSVLPVSIHETRAKLSAPGFSVASPRTLRLADRVTAKNRCESPTRIAETILERYDPGPFYCELTNSPASLALRERLGGLGPGDLETRAAAAHSELNDLGVTFTVYSDENAVDRVLPFDALPRIISAAEWARIERGVIQRVTTLNLLLDDIYHDQKIVKDGVIPADLILGNANFRPEMLGLDLPHKTYVNVCGSDIIRDQKGQLYVLEDNARTPSGVSYVVENRHLMLRAFPDLMDGFSIRSIGGYGVRLAAALREMAPLGGDDHQAVLLSPGPYNSAYFEHVFLAREMGIPLVTSRDLVVENDRVYLRTIGPRVRVLTIYRRIDDAFLDPLVFRGDSAIGVPGLMDAYRAGNVALANAVGSGVADDKAIYAYIPRAIRYYLGEDPVLSNVETHICREREALAYTLENLASLVVKPVGESGGYGITIGPEASLADLDQCRSRLLANPDGYISQPCISLSVAPTLVGDAIEPRHVDLRPFAITGSSTWVLPGGLTRVALREGSLLVNSSQGGGSKDTWVLDE